MLHFENFALQEQLEGNLMVSISRVWYNCSYTMAAKPIKSLELHYTMIQFLINIYIMQISFVYIHEWKLIFIIKRCSKPRFHNEVQNNSEMDH